MAINKVVFDALRDVNNESISGSTVYKINGEQIHINKVVLGANTLIDITDTTATAGKIASGYTAYGANGVKVVGTLEQEVNELEVGGATVEGTAAIFDEGGSGGSVIISDSTDPAGGTIREITSADEVYLQTKTITPTLSQQTIVPDTGYDGFSSVIVNAYSGGGTPSQTQHTIYFEFSDSTDTTITAYWDGTFISDAITATTPSTYGQNTVTLAQLAGVTWYEPANIPIGVQLIDYSEVTNDYAITTASGLIEATEWLCVTDYILIDPTMTFSYSGCYWYYIAFYDSSNTFISTIYMYTDGTPDQSDGNIAHGTLTPAKIPSNAMYVRITGFKNPSSNSTSLIRTA